MSPCCHFLDDIFGRHEITYVKPIRSIKCDLLGSFSFTHSEFLPCSYVRACVRACVRVRVHGACVACMPTLVGQYFMKATVRYNCLL